MVAVLGVMTTRSLVSIGGLSSSSVALARFVIKVRVLALLSNERDSFYLSFGTSHQIIQGPFHPERESTAARIDQGTKKRK